MKAHRILRNTRVSASTRPLPLGHAENDKPSTQDTPAQPDREKLKKLFAAELTALADEARAQGREEGLRDANESIGAQLKTHQDRLDQAYQAKVAELDGLMNEFKAAAAALQQERSASAKEAEAIAVEIAYAATSKMLTKSATSRKTLPGLVRAAVRELDPAQTLRIRVSGPDYKTLQGSATASLRDALPPNVEFIADESLTPTACIVEHQRGRLDSSLMTQMESFRQTLLSVYKREEATE